eukprot:9113962-Pyramimonas_sp.AAC.1
MGVGEAYEPGHWGLRWSPLWDHEPCEGCAEIGVGRMRTLPLGLSVEPLCGATNCVSGVPKWTS